MPCRPSAGLISISVWWVASRTSFYTEDDGWEHRILEGNKPAGKLPITGTYTMNCLWEKGKEQSKCYPYTPNHGKTAPAYYSTDGITDRAIRMINETNDAGDQPYFL